MKIAIILIVIFLLASWITLMIPLSINNSVEAILCVVIGLVAVNIAGFSIIINKLDLLQYKIKGGKNKEDKIIEQDKTSGNDGTP